MMKDECRIRNAGDAPQSVCPRSPFCTHQSAFRFRRAFTLLELVLVMFVMSVVLAMVAPSLSGFGAGREAEYAGAQVMTLARWAREQAISEGRVYRLNFDPASQTYWVTAQIGGVFEPINHDFGQQFALPEFVVMAWDTPQVAGAHVIDCYPSGRIQPARIQVTSRDGQVTLIGNRTATESLRVLTPEEVAAG